jgi:hypothetical protein
MGSADHITITSVCAASAVGSRAKQRVDVEGGAMVDQRREPMDAYLRPIDPTAVDILPMYC